MWLNKGASFAKYQIGILGCYDWLVPACYIYINTYTLSLGWVFASVSVLLSDLIVFLEDSNLKQNC